MPIRQSIWKVGRQPQPLAEARLESEQQLEEMIVASPGVLSEDIMLIGRQVKEQERKARREEQLRRRREQREELFNTAEQWRRTQTLREFIEAVRAAAIERAKGGRIHPDTMRWLDWATKTANRADPIEQMKADSDRCKVKRKPK